MTTKMRRNSYILKNGYCLSYVQSLAKQQQYPWICAYISDQISDCVGDLTIVKRAKYYYYRVDNDFLLLISWTMVTVVMFTVVTFSNMITNLLWVLLPIFMTFFTYLWTGLLLKRLSLPFSLSVCLFGSFVVELFVELFTLSQNGVTPTNVFCGIVVSALIVSLLMGMMRDVCTNPATWMLLCSLAVVRLSLMEECTLLPLHGCLPPLVAYGCIFGGLSVSSLNNLKIPHFDVEDMDFRHSTNTTCHNDADTIPIVRQRRASSVEVPVLHQNGVNTANVKTRRKSLPVLGYTPNKKFSMSSVDLSILAEAHGMITDLLADSSLPANVSGTLRIVADMICPLLQNSFSKQHFSTALLTVLEKNQCQVQEDEQQVMNQPDFKDDTPLSLKQRLQRNLGVSSRRMSSSYTTTTSATGMPTIDLEYHSKRNILPMLSHNKNELTKRPANRSKSCAGLLPERKLFATSKSHSFSQSQGNKKDLYTDDGIFKVDINKDKPVYFDGMDTSADDEYDEEDNDDTRKVTDDLSDGVSCELIKKADASESTATETTQRTALSSVCESTENVSSHTCETNENNSEQTNEHTNDRRNERKLTFEDDDISVRNDVGTTSELQESEYDPSYRDGSRSIESNDVNENDNVNDVERETDNSQEGNNSSNISGSCSASENSSSTTCSQNRLRNQCNDLGNLPLPATYNKRKTSRELHMEYEKACSKDVDELLCRINEWDFPIFELHEKCNVLTQLAFRIYTQCDFFKKFKIPEATFLKYFRALESGYHDIPYHNRIHAADVLHGVYYLTQHKIPGFTENFCSRRSSIGEIPEEDCGGVPDDEVYSYGCLADAMPDLDLMGLYTAAAMHDFDHPGRTNAFLVATLNPKALLYNDRSVLESHHAAASWSLLVRNPGLNFLAEMDPAEFKRFRFIVIEEILSTDLKKHFDFLTEWNAKTSEQGGGLNFSCESDRLLVGQMAIKLADISGPTKEWNLHLRWTERLIEEFYLQGEDERSLGIPLSAYMDRSNPKVPPLQASFINHLVSPLYAAYEKANTMPGEWVDADSDSEDADSVGHSTNTSDGESTTSVEVEKVKPARKKKVLYSCITDNINKNYKKWCEIVEETEKGENASENGEGGEKLEETGIDEGSGKGQGSDSGEPVENAENTE